MVILHFITMNLEYKLNKAGFLTNEVKTYIAILGLGKGTLAEISRRAGLNKVNTIDKLRKLAKKQLVIQEKDNKKRLYVALPPRHALRRYLNTLKEGYNEKESMVLDSIEGLEIHHSTPKDMPEVKFAEGKEVIQAIHLEVQNTQYDEMLEMTNLDTAFRDVTVTQKREHRSMLSKKKSSLRCFYTSQRGAILSPKFKKQQRKFVPYDVFPFEGEIATFSDKVIIVSTDPKKLCVIIRDRCIAKTMRALFEWAWYGIKVYQDNNKKKLDVSISHPRTRMESSHSLGHKPSPVNQMTDGEPLKGKHNNFV